MASSSKPKVAMAVDKKTAKIPTAHAKYSDMVMQAVTTLKERKGASRQAILKYIKANFDLGLTNQKLITSHLRKALKHGVETKMLVQPAIGRFRIPDSGVTTKKAMPSKNKVPLGSPNNSKNLVASTSADNPKSKGLQAKNVSPKKIVKSIAKKSSPKKVALKKIKK